jgi:hypothetical protein
MRRLVVLAAVVWGLAWVSAASAQQAVTWGGPTGPRVSHVIDTNQSMAPFNTYSSEPASSGVSGFFSKLNPFKKKQSAPAMPTRTKVPVKNPNLPARVLP